MVLRPDRIRGLLAAKRLKQSGLDNVTGGELGKWLCGEREPDLEDLKRLATALNATSDYLIGLGDDYGDNYTLAASKMAFTYFYLDPDVPDEQKRRCRRILESDALLMRQGAPRTAAEWKVLADMVDKAVPPRPPHIGEARTA